MKRTAAILTLVGVVSMFGASDVRAGAALVPAGKTTGPAVIATVVTDVTGPAFTAGKGLTSIRVQKASSSAAVVFTSSLINGLADQCVADPNVLPGINHLPAGTDARFSGFLVDGWIDDGVSLGPLLSQFGVPGKAAISDTDYATCTTVNGRQILSFTAVIQFQP